VVREFIAQSKNEIVYKTLSQSLHTEAGKSLFTSIVTEDALANLDLIQLTPGIFQQLVPKAYELRATVVGPRIFSARIDSQSRAETKIDWRHLPFEADAAVDLPPDIEGKIHAFMKAFGLVYGAFDFIVTPEGRHVFLEVNPAGQYMWIESKLRLPITAALADALCDPC
jgi:glutathione synthase/RimK-type ligase-like ATP-grasp enzyme